MLALRKQEYICRQLYLKTSPKMKGDVVKEETADEKGYVGRSV